MATYTVIGLWYQAEPIVAGVIEGEHSAVDSDPSDRRFQGRWATSVEANDPVGAESRAVAEMSGEDPDEEEAVLCKFCRHQVPARTAHLHQGGWVGDECCWDERLRSTE
jgi:hypothetical protein